MQPAIELPARRRIVHGEEALRAMRRQCPSRGRRTPAQKSSGGTPAWSPASLPGLVLWLRASAGVTLNGSTISAMADQSGAGIITSFAQATASAQPTFIAAGGSGINGKADISWSPSTATGIYGTTASLFTTAGTWATAFKTTTSQTDRTMCGARFNNYHFDLSTDTVNGGQYLARANTSVSGTVVHKSTSTALNDGAVHTLIAVWTGATLTLYVDGAAQAAPPACTGTLVSPATNNDPNCWGGAINAAGLVSNQWVGQSPEYIVAHQAASAGDVANLHTYLAAA